MRTTYHTITGTLTALVISGCVGTGSGLMGIAGGGGGTGSNVPPVLSFFVQPNSSNVGQTITPAVEVLARDSLGATDTSFTGTITVALASNSTGAALSGTTTVRPVNGIASFAIDQVGTYTLTASSSGSATVTSSAFSVTTVTTP